MATTNNHMRRWWRWAVPLAALTMSFVAAELVLGALDRDAPTHYLQDPVRGWRLRPGFAGWREDEVRLWVQINSDGLRDREHSLAAPPNTLRVAVMGDSYMEAMNLPFEKSFTPNLEERLNGCLQGSGRRAEVLNFGVAGYGTVQELLAFRQHVVNYRPDIVLLAVYTANDIIDNHAALASGDDDWRPYFKLRGETLELAPAPVAEEESPAGLPWYQRWRIAITDRSRVAQRTYAAWASFRKRFLPAPPPDASGVADRGESRDALIYRPAAGEMAEAWRITEATFRQLAREVAVGGAEFWMATLSNLQQVHPDPAARTAYAKSIGVESLFYADWRIRDFARANGIPFVMLAEPLAAYSQRTGEFLNGGTSAEFPFGTGHWNETGHRLAAGIVGDRLCAESGTVRGR